MIQVSDFGRMLVCKELPEHKRKNAAGELVHPPILGKIHFAVFTPDGKRVVGFMVKQPDAAGMIKLPDRFVPLDALKEYQGVLVVRDSKDSFDQRAAERLGIDLDACVIWTGMDVKTQDGRTLGYCTDARFDYKTGCVESFTINDGAAARAIVGSILMPASHVIGYKNGCMIVDNDTSKLVLSGGCAAKAAEASVVATQEAKKVAAKVSKSVDKGTRALDEHGSKLVNQGSKALGKQLKKSKGMFKAFRDEYKKAAGTPSKKKK